MRKVKEACGVVAAYSKGGVDVVPLIAKGLEALQHRGQESWGIALTNGAVFKRMGIVAERHTYAEELKSLSGSSGIGHVRYSTKGRSAIENAQPIEIESEFTIAHNGTIVDTDSLVEKISKEFKISRSDSDTKLVGLRFLQVLRDEKDWFWAFKKLSKELIGAYSLVMANKEGGVYVIRDPRGYRPLCLGWSEESKTLFAASESCGLTAMGAELVRDVEPGEMVRLEDGFEQFRFAPRTAPAYCAFEYTYFAHPSSRINGINVYEARKRIGRILAQRTEAKGDVVIPVPDSARPAALGYSQESRIALDEGLMKDRYRKKGTMRSFIEPTEGSREEIVKQIIPIREVVSGKEVIVVDDSVVRGTSSKVIADALHSAGAKKIKMVITFPPIISPCYMGIDFPSREELLAYRACGDDDAKDVAKVGKKVAEDLGVDQIYYNDVDGLSEGIGIPKEHLCLACVTGDYTMLGIKPKFRSREEMKC